MDLGNKILKLRKQNGLSQEQLGERINVTRQTISNWELSETLPNSEQLKLLSKELHVSIDELLDNNYSNKDNVVIKNNFNTIVKYIGMFFVNIFALLGFILLYSWFLVMVLFSIALLSGAVCLLLQLKIGNIIPYMPYWCGFLTAISFVFLAVLFILSSILYLKFINKLLNSYIQIERNILEIHKEKNIKVNNVFPNKKILLYIKISLIGFILLFSITFIVCMIFANNLSFWHTWNWWL